MADIEAIAERLLALLRTEHPDEADDVLAAILVNGLIVHLGNPEGGPAFAAAVNLRLAEAAAGDRTWQLVELGAEQVQRLRQAAGAAMHEAQTAPRN